MSGGRAKPPYHESICPYAAILLPENLSFTTTGCLPKGYDQPLSGQYVFLVDVISLPGDPRQGKSYLLLILCL